MSGNQVGDAGLAAPSRVAAARRVDGAYFAARRFAVLDAAVPDGAVKDASGRAPIRSPPRKASQTLDRDQCALALEYLLSSAGGPDAPPPTFDRAGAQLVPRWLPAWLNSPAAGEMRALVAAELCDFGDSARYARLAPSDDPVARVVRKTVATTLSAECELLGRADAVDVLEANENAFDLLFAHYALPRRKALDAKSLARFGVANGTGECLSREASLSRLQGAHPQTRCQPRDLSTSTERSSRSRAL